MCVCVCVCVFMLVSQLCPTLCHPIDCNPSGSAVRGILQARILRWVAIPFSRGSSLDRTRISCDSCIAGGFFTSEPPGKPCFFKWMLNVSKREFYWVTCGVKRGLKLHTLKFHTQRRAFGLMSVTFAFYVFQECSHVLISPLILTVGLEGLPRWLSG